MQKKKVAVVYGGFSGEAAVSVKSAENVYSAINKDIFIPVKVEITELLWAARPTETESYVINKNDFSYLDGHNNLQKFDFAFIIIHGSPGENGLLQAYFELINLPYSTGNQLSMALTFSKINTNTFLKQHGIACGASVPVTAENLPELSEIKKYSLPLFVKPSGAGSSLGITKVKKYEDVLPAIEHAFLQDTSVLVEPAISGREITVGVFSTSFSHLAEPIALPPTEIIPKNEYFDFESKYSGESTEITPAQIGEEATINAKNLAKKVYKIFNCRGIIRVDMFLKPDGSLYVIEPNTVPGMTNQSLIPQQIAAARLSLTDIFSEIINNGINKV